MTDRKKNGFVLIKKKANKKTYRKNAQKAMVGGSNKAIMFNIFHWLHFESHWAQIDDTPHSHLSGGIQSVCTIGKCFP